METSDGGSQWREREVLDLISIWGDTPIQSYRNPSPPQQLLINVTAAITQSFRNKSPNADFLHKLPNFSAAARCV